MENKKMNSKRKTTSLGLIFMLLMVLSLTTAQANPVHVNAPTGDPAVVYEIGVLAPISGEDGKADWVALDKVMERWLPDALIVGIP